MMDAFDDRLDEAGRALGERVPELPDSLDDAIMARIRQQPHGRTAAPPHRGFVSRLMQPREVRIRPIWIPVAMAAVLAILLIPRGQRAPVTPQPVAASDTVYVHFALSAPNATNVALAGSFNNWEAAGLSLHKAADGSWEATIALPVGEHRYQFVVDGQRWIPDPSAQANIDDGFGGTNSVIVVGPKGVVRS
jgi:hypothetical protein